MVTQRPEQGIRQVVQPRHEEGGAAASRIANLQSEDDLRFLRDERAILSLVVAERLQGSVDGRHRQFRSGVERPRPLAGIASPDEIELAQDRYPLDELRRLSIEAGLILTVSLPRPLPAHHTGKDSRIPCPAPCGFLCGEVLACA